MFLKVRAKQGSANPVFLVQAIRNTSSANVPSVIREIEIWRAAVLMLSRYAGDAEANSFRRAVELRPKGESRRSAPKLAAEGDHAGAAIWRRATVALALTSAVHTQGKGIAGHVPPLRLPNKSNTRSC
jgi:hypothetical protein